MEIGNFFESVPELFPLIVSGSAPIANFSSGILRVIGDDLITAEDVSQAFEIKNGLAELTVSNGEQALIISSATQDTGVDQCFFHAKNRGESMEITKLAVFAGNALDIDQWHLDNFSFIA